MKLLKYNAEVCLPFCLLETQEEKSLPQFYGMLFHLYQVSNLIKYVDKYITLSYETHFFFFGL